ncbi:MAG: 3-deoxy-D-manno-octulosonic acid transferase [Candidatus Lightella neohaematopini]|nr:3-deoxy-D-manno-octulosonic acid transferase [Candidatus Lightella neohaematopini]
MTKFKILLINIIYNIILYLLQPILIIRIIWSIIKKNYYHNKWYERYGFYKDIKSNSIVLHAASVGETLSIVPLINILKNYYPSTSILITNITFSGKIIVNSYFNCVDNVYLPYDIKLFVNKFINYVKPKIFIIVETELWPNLIKILNKKNIPIILINARISNSSFRKYKIISDFMSNILNNINYVFAQSTLDSNRFKSLGITSNKLEVINNLKFDIHLTKNILIKSAKLRFKWSLYDRPILIASSTHPGEEILIIKAYKKLIHNFPNLLLIIAPRSIKRINELIYLMSRNNLSYTIFSKHIMPSKQHQVLLIDTIGDLLLLYGISDIAIIGGSLLSYGGHNPLEAIVHNIPVIVGQYTNNLHEIYHKLKKSNSIIIVNSLNSLIKEINNLLYNKAYYHYRICHTNLVLNKYRGSSKKIVQLIDKYVKKSYLPRNF